VDAARSRVARAIAAEARSWGAQVIVVARRRRTAIGVLLLGSLSAQLMREAGCPVLTTRPRRR
jgi:nucleotide-binding universal stress UspA family protein